MTQQAIITLVVLLIVSVLLAWNRFPMALVTMSAAMVLVVTGCLEPKTVLSNIGNSNAVIMASTFVVATGLTRTQMLNKASSLVNIVSKGSWKRMMLGYCIVAGILVEITGSVLGTFAIIYPFLIAMCKDHKLSISKVIYPIGLISICNGISFPIGISATAYMEYNGYLESLGYGQWQFGFWDFFKGKFMICVLVILYAAFISIRISPEKASLPPASMSFSNKDGTQVSLTPFQEFCGYGLFIYMIVGLCVADIIGIPAWVIVLIGALLEVLTGVLSEKEAISSVPWNMILMFVGALCIANAVDAAGIATLIGGSIARMLSGVQNGYLIGAICFIIPFITTQFLSNRGTILMFCPFVISICKSLSCNPLGPILLLITACGCAIFTPMGCAGTPYVMSAGGYSIKDMFKQGWVFSVFMCVVSVAWIMTIFPAY